ncbi:hypothetical protein [uncultured Friedmanniella sp.]|uniref:hypothetical protein n=1 Tax=uncultured Friedmanniella sp. TaxID=335381 RepID=UPI0035CBCDB7
MSATPPTPPPQRFTLNAPPPVRPLAIAAGTVVVGAVLLVLWHGLSLPLAAAVLAGLLLVLGVALVLAALLFTARLRTEVRLYPDAITVRRRDQERSVSWREITEVSLTHPRLALLTAERTGGVVVVNPRQASDPVFSSLVEEVRRRLDADRGYSDQPLSPS